MTSSSKTETKPAVNRVLRVLRPVAADGSGRIRLTVTKGRKVLVDDYELQTFPAYDGAAVGVRLDKQDGSGTVYHVCLAHGADRSCDCRGHQRWGCECKHLAALQLLRDQDQLPLPAMPHHEEPVEVLDLLQLAGC